MILFIDHVQVFFMYMKALINYIDILIICTYIVAALYFSRFNVAKNMQIRTWTLNISAYMYVNQYTYLRHQIFS